ncbi:MAG: phosphoribosylamine--glycine ligase [Chloroflexota bacterium]
MKKVLLIGSGGREHTLAWKISKSPNVAQLFVAPGNGGTAGLEKTKNISISVSELSELCNFARKESIDLTVVGPEVPLVAGIVDTFSEVGLRIFGPTKAAAQLEGSKAFAKEFMVRHQIPTAESATFDDFDECMRYLRNLVEAPVIKASGLAAGKGVLLPETREEAARFLQRILLEGQFGEAGRQVVLEERLKGRELSVLAFCDGTDFVIMPPAQDHKRLLNGDYGPNTGGMGAYTPSPLTTPELLAQVEDLVIRPTLTGMKAEGAPYRGVLYVGLMLTDQGLKVLEFNCRFGDPETQVVLPLLESDIMELFDACVEGQLGQLTQLSPPRWSRQAAVTVVMASPGYPGEYPVGVEINGIEQAEATGCMVFHAGTKFQEATRNRHARLLTDGGRVLAITALGKRLGGARHMAYMGVAKIDFNESVYRTDIGKDG